MNQSQCLSSPHHMIHNGVCYEASGGLSRHETTS